MTKAASVAVMTLCSLPGSLAYAAPPSLRDALPKEQRATFDEGSKLYREKRFVDAREAFLAVFAQAGDARVLFNVAVCEKALGRYAEAIASIERSLALQGASAAPDFVTRATAALDALAAYVGSVRLDANVDNVTFTVDGLAAKDGLLRLNSGAHTITAQKPNYTSASQRIDIVAGETRSLHFDLTPMDTNVTTTIQCETSRACSIQVDGVVLGPAPARLAREPGSYRVRATVEGKPFGEKQLDLAVGAPTTVLIRAQQLPRLHVRTEHADESVTIDGVLMGQGSLETELFAGEHTVTVTSSKGQRRSIELVLRERESRDVFLALRDSEREPSVDKSGLSPWWFIGGSAVLLGAAATAVYFALAPTRYEGSGAGSLNPYVVTATHPGGWYRW